MKSDEHRSTPNHVDEEQSVVHHVWFNYLLTLITPSAAMSETPKEKLNKTYQSTAANLEQDMPLLLHGGGDVMPNEV